jgi:protein-tyrosine phosphatase
MHSIRHTSHFPVALLCIALALSGCANHKGAQTAAHTPQPQKVAQQIDHPRLLPVEGAQNFRDLGGYVGANGRTVRWGLLYRSGSMHGLTPADFNYLEDLPLRTVVDLRSTQERTQQPVVWPAEHAPTVLSQDYVLDASSLMKTIGKPNVGGEEMRDALSNLYEEIPFKFAGQYRSMFARLLNGDVPLAFNCSAGKDRTGVAAALLLTALGVSHETVVQDYLLSNEYYRPTSSLHGLSPDAAQALNTVDRRYLEAAFAAIEKQSGSVDNYFKDQLGLSKQDIALLRDKYLL